jgi:hypothetical protein
LQDGILVGIQRVHLRLGSVDFSLYPLGEIDHLIASVLSYMTIVNHWKSGV